MKTRLPFLLLLFALPAVIRADDWPQWRGPNRDDVSKETGLLKKWSEPPSLLWTYENAGNSYSGIAVVGDTLYTMGADESQEFVLALRVKDGQKVWQTPYGSRFGNQWGDGPRGTPTIDGDYLYAIGGQGDLVCMERAVGRVVWKKNLRTDLGGQLMTGWGYSESPLIDGNKLICTPGGAKGTLAALDKKTGEVIWRSSGAKNAAGYSSVIVADVGGLRQYIQLTRDGVIGVAAADGKLLWSSSLGGCRTAAIPTPIYHDNHVFVTSGYGDSVAGLLKLTADAAAGTVKAEEVYSGRTLVNKHGGVVLVDGVLYGNSEAGGPWVAMDFKTGKKLGWDKPGLRNIGSITYADGRLYLYSESDGTVVLLEPNPTTWTEAGRFKLPRQTKIRSPRGRIWTHPVVAHGRLYLRDQDLIFCYDVKAK